MMFWIEAVLLCAVFTLLVVPSLLRDPLAWVGDYPPAIAERARTLYPVPEQPDTTLAGLVRRKLPKLLFSGALFAVLVIAVNGAETFAEGFWTSYALWLVIDWYDALVLDCLWFCHSRRVVIPGTEDLKAAYRDYGFHIRMSAAGMALGLPVCLLAGALTAAFRLLLP